MKTREQFTLKGPININQNTREILEVLLDIRDIALNKLTKEEELNKLYPLLKEGGFPNTKEEEYKEGRYTLPGYIPKTASEDQDRYDEELLATYKARLRERIKNDLEGDRSLVRAEVYKRVLDLIDKE